MSFVPRRTRLLGLSVAIASVTIAATLTNPNQADYVDYASTALVSEFRSAICGEPTEAAPDSWIEQTTALFQLVCSSVIAEGGAFSNQILSDWIDAATVRQNYLVFSLYRTQVPGEDVRTIAAFGHFMPLW